MTITLIKLATESGLGVVFSLALLGVLFYVVKEQYKLINMAKQENARVLKAWDEIISKLHNLTVAVRVEGEGLQEGLTTLKRTSEEIHHNTKTIKSKLDELIEKLTGKD